jgi:hypothetical protein
MQFDEKIIFAQLSACVNLNFCETGKYAPCREIGGQKNNIDIRQDRTKKITLFSPFADSAPHF